MLKYLLPILFLIPFIGTAQIDTSVVDDIIIGTQETMPEFAGGQNEFFNFLKANLKYPPSCRDQGIQGTVFITLLVQKDGTLDSITVVKGVHPTLDAEAVRVFSIMPKWTAGTVNGEPVAVQFSFPINFVVHNDSPTPNNRDKGHKYLKEGDYEKSIYYFSKIIKVNKDDIDLLYHRGIAYHKNGEIKKAIKDLEKAKQLGSKEAEEYLKTIEK